MANSEMSPHAQLTHHVMALVAPYITPIFGWRSDGIPYSIGTATYIEHRNRRFIVTAGHVAAKCRQGYQLGVFAGQLNAPGSLHRDWRTSLDASWCDGEWGEDVAILDVTDCLGIDKLPLSSTFLTGATDFQEDQGILLSGYAKNPRSASDASEMPLLQQHDMEEMIFKLRALTSLESYMPSAPVNRPSQFCVHFDSTHNQDIHGNDLNYVFSAKGFSGSAVWRVRNSPPSNRDVALEGLEIIGIARGWSENGAAILVTKGEQVINLLDTYIRSLEDEAIPGAASDISL
ncbi:MAG: hypothetical protein JWL77_4766 [Chthonomonadaceae bacterium]|nr:hypothetical protein [Chthonomonadaceae bacterium]